MPPGAAATVWLITGAGLLLAAVSIPLWLGRVKPNKWYGIRIATALESEEEWYRMNRIGGITGVVCGFAQAVIGVLLLVYPPDSERLLLLAVLLIPVLTLPVAVVPMVAASRRR